MRLLILFLFFHLSIFAQDEPSESTEPFTFSDTFFTFLPWDNPFKNWPIRVSTLSLDVYQSSYEIDVTNEFGHHLIVKSNPQTQQTFKVAIQFFRLFDIWYRHKTEEVTIEETSSFVINQNTFDFKDSQFGLGTNFNVLRIELGLGKYKNVTFLQTDTSFFYILPFEANYLAYNIQILIPTKLGINVLGQLLGKYYFPNEDDTLKIENGAAREVLGGLIFPVFGFQFIPYYAFNYESYKFTHKFFGLENEMSNKVSSERLGLNFVIPF